MNIKVAVRGIMLDSPAEKFSPYIETRLRAQAPVETSSFVRGMIWGFLVSAILWTILTVVAIRYWL